MMRSTFKYTVLYLFRERSIIIWALAFPVILSTLFSVMFGNMDELVYARDLGVVVVEDAGWNSDDAYALREVVSGASEEGSSPDGESALFTTTYVGSEDEARVALDDDGKAADSSDRGDGGPGSSGNIAYLMVASDGTPHLHMKSNPADSSLAGKQTVLKTVIDSSVRIRTAVQDAVESRALAAASGAASEGASVDAAVEAEVAESLEHALAMLDATYTEDASVTTNPPVETTRYYYALLGMAALMAAAPGLYAMARCLANTSELGARRSLGALRKSRMVLASFGAAWLVAFACLLVAFAYMRLVLDVDFGGKDVPCVLALFVASFMSTALGMLIGALPGMHPSAKSGLLTAIACFGALFAGLYGQPCMKLADVVTEAAPWADFVNPAKLVSNAFYSLYYYDGYDPYAVSLAVLTGMGLVLLAGAAILARKDRHEHI